MKSGIGRVAASVALSRPDPLWVDRATLVSTERKVIDTFLGGSPRPIVYGFTTLFGQLDHQSIAAADQEKLLQGHLIGPCQEVSDPLPSLMTSIKLEQLAHGGSGLHAETYRALLDHCSSQEFSAKGSWDSSYGSADVVPGAWWFQSWRDPAHPIHPGDLIALISGNFVSTAFSLAAVIRLIDYLSCFLGHAIQHAAPIPAHASSSSRTWLYQSLSCLPSGSSCFTQKNIQHSVSLRDASMYASPISKIIDELRDCLEFRLSGCSSNPLFIFSEPEMVDTYSQSGFIDLRLSMAMTSAVQVVLFCMGGVQRFIQHWCSGKNEMHPSEFVSFIQPPKVAAALLMQSRQIHGALASGFTMAESDGIEDVCDISLHIALGLDDVVRRATQQISVLEDLTSHLSPVCRESISRILVGRMLGDESSEQDQNDWFKLSGRLGRHHFFSNS